MEGAPPEGLSLASPNICRMSFASGSALPPTAFEVASAFPEVAWLRQAAAAGDPEALWRYFHGLPHGTDRAFPVGIVSEV